MLYIYLPVLYYHSNLYIIEGVYAGGRGFPLSQRSFLFMLRRLHFLLFFSVSHVTFIRTLLRHSILKIFYI